MKILRVVIVYTVLWILLIPCAIRLYFSNARRVFKKEARLDENGEVICCEPEIWGYMLYTFRSTLFWKALNWLLRKFCEKDEADKMITEDEFDILKIFVKRKT